MDALRRPTVSTLICVLSLAGPVLLVSVLAWMLGAPPLVLILLPALIAGTIGAVGHRVLQRDRPIERAADAQTCLQDPHQVVTQGIAEQLAERDRAASMLRHDLRGILSPALLTADRLTTHQDPMVQRAGEVLIQTVERAEARLKPPLDAQGPHGHPRG